MYKPDFKNTAPTEFVLNEYTRGFAQCVDNNWNYAIYAQDPSVSIYQNEYNAGYVQGKVQTNRVIKATRNNTWRWYVLDEGPGADSVTPPQAAVDAAVKILNANYNYLTDWAEKNQHDEKAQGIIRLMFRMLGIYHGAADKEPLADVTFDNLKIANMAPEDAEMHSGDEPLTFIDIYFLNAQMDLWDAAAKEIGVAFNRVEKDDEEKRLDKLNGPADRLKPGRCSGFVKKLPSGEILWAHTSWCCLFAQSCAVTYVIGSDFLTQNSFCPGQFGSNTDFGFNGNGIGFNETTHVDLYDKTKIDGVWLTYRSAAAEQFARSIQEFYEYCSLDNTGTYLNGYHIIDANTGEIGLLDMSYNRFVLFTCNGKEVKMLDSTGYEPNHLDYDHHLISPSHIFGVNQPVSWWVGYELESMNLRPMRRNQLWQRLDTVTDIESAKDLITYTEDREPLSIYGRWDLGYGTTEMPRVRPDGSVDAKAFSRELIKETLAGLSRKPSISGQKTSFWMKFGTAHVRQLPFIWSQSQFADMKQPESVDFVPDALDGRWNRVKMFME